MDKPLGYVSYSFGSHNTMDYTSVLQITNILSVGLGGYIINLHHQYLYNKVEEMYKTDALTKLYNRYGFQVALEEYKNNREYLGKPVTFIVCDLDGLKFINDNCMTEDVNLDIAIKQADDEMYKNKKMRKADH